MFLLNLILLRKVKVIKTNIINFPTKRLISTKNKDFVSFSFIYKNYYYSPERLNKTLKFIIIKRLIFMALSKVFKYIKQRNSNESYEFLIINKINK